MKTDNQRIAIATHLGFFNIEPDKWMGHTQQPGEWADWVAIPDYPSSLDAAIELCHVLAKQGWWCALEMDDDDEIWRCAFSHSEHEAQLAVNAKLPLAICEAFLECLGLWKDEEGE